MASIEELQAQVAQLQAQQNAQTNAIKALAEGRATGPDSAEAWLIALNPSFAGKLHVIPFVEGE